ncbi:MAG: DNA repair protein RecO, partial [Methylobacterium sp.]
LLALPDFLRARELGAPPPMTPDIRAVTEGFTLTGYFLDQHIWGPRALPPPDARARFVALGTGSA